MKEERNGNEQARWNTSPDDGKEAWKEYWKAQGQSWRTEPEIDGERQKYLSDRRSITPNIEQAIYPFKDVELSRADVEWLLTTHENGRGPVDWSDESQRERRGLDLRGADLHEINLTRLPLANKLDDPLTILAAIEAFVGLLIEVTFIATLTRRLFGR